jgi:hypothetical protein
MIVNKDINPNRQVYYIASLILREINNSTSNEIDFFEIYFKLKTENGLSMNLFTFSLDWLYLLGALEEKEGKILKCL